MRTIHKPVLMLCLGLLSARAETADPQDPPELASLRATYTEALAAAQSGSAKPSPEILQAYEKALADFKEARIEEGDFDGVMAARKEIERFGAARGLPGEDSFSDFPDLAALQGRFVAAATRHTTQKGAKPRQLAVQYVRRLETRVKELTQDGKIGEALAFDAEIRRVKAGPEYAAAVPDPGAAAQAQSSRPAGRWVDCRECGGTGRAPTTCRKCGASGKCSVCGGTGQRPPQMVGGKPVMCITCRGTGKCPACKGSGEAAGEGSCLVCGGRGKVRAAPEPPPEPEYVTEPGPQYEPPAHPAAPPPEPVYGPPRVSPTEADEAFASWRAAVSEFDSLLEKGDTQTISFSHALRRRDELTGKLLKSEVNLLQAHPKGIRVASTRSGAQEGGTLLIPRSRGIGIKATRLFKQVKWGGTVTLTYGFVNEENSTFFDISAGSLTDQPDDADLVKPVPLPSDS
ncbi:hypothetical protein ACFLSJ_03905 [Verrucomicrobiota bacterium]